MMAELPPPKAFRNVSSDAKRAFAATTGGRGGSQTPSGAWWTFRGTGIIILIRMEAAMVKLKLTTIGTSTGVVLPKEVLSRLGVEKGDTLYLTEAPDGFRLVPYDPDFEEKMTKAEDIMGRYRNTLRVLAQ
jgi:putative addiction module antidote